MTKRISIISLMLLITWFLPACSSKPEAELAGAEAAVSQAKAAEAETYAPDAYREVVQLMNEAKIEIETQSNKFALTRDFESAKQKLIRTQEMAVNCLKSAQETKEMVRIQTEQALLEAEQALTQAQAAFETAPTGKGTKADLEMIQADLQAAQTALEEARTIMNSGRYYEANPKLTAVKNHADAISTEIEQAKSRRTRSRS